MAEEEFVELPESLDLFHKKQGRREQVKLNHELFGYDDEEPSVSLFFNPDENSGSAMFYALTHGDEFVISFATEKGLAIRPQDIAGQKRVTATIERKAAEGKQDAIPIIPILRASPKQGDCMLVLTPDDHGNAKISFDPEVLIIDVNKTKAKLRIERSL